MPLMTDMALEVVTALGEVPVWAPVRLSMNRAPNRVTRVTRNQHNLQNIWLCSPASQ